MFHIESVPGSVSRKETVAPSWGVDPATATGDHAAHGVTLSWSPPAFGISLASALLGLALALAHAVVRAVRRRPRPATAVREPAPVAEPVASR